MTAFFRTLNGKNKTGQIIHGVLDVMPIPPIHNIIRQAFKEDVPKAQIPAYVWQKLDKLRLTTSAFAIAVAGAVMKGWITLEEAKEFLKIIAQLI